MAASGGRAEAVDKPPSSLEVPLPLSPYPLKVRAIVRYRQGLHYGFEFLTLNESQRDTVSRVCQMLATRS